MNLNWSRVFFWWCLLVLPLNVADVLTAALTGQILWGIFHAFLLAANITWAYVCRARIQLLKMEQLPAP